MAKRAPSLVSLVAEFDRKLVLARKSVADLSARSKTPEERVAVTAMQEVIRLIENDMEKFKARAADELRMASKTPRRAGRKRSATKGKARRGR